MEKIFPPLHGPPQPKPSSYAHDYIFPPPHKNSVCNPACVEIENSLQILLVKDQKRIGSYKIKVITCAKLVVGCLN